MLQVGNKYKAKQFRDHVQAPIWELVYLSKDKEVSVIQDVDGYMTTMASKLLEEDYVSISSEVLKFTDECVHIWGTYIGFTESYEYCKNCGEKK